VTVRKEKNERCGDRDPGSDDSGDGRRGERRFQLIKRYIPENKPLRRRFAGSFTWSWPLAESWLAGDVLGLMGSWQEATLTAEQVFGFGSAVFAAATVVYNAYYKMLKPRLTD
jgi:hypothetical protein